MICLLMAYVIGCKRVPEPPARIIPFISNMIGNGNAKTGDNIEKLPENKKHNEAQTIMPIHDSLRLSPASAGKHSKQLHEQFHQVKNNCCNGGTERNG